MPAMTAVLPLIMLMQIGPGTHVFTPAPLPITSERRDAPKPAVVAPRVDPLSDCLRTGRDDADAGLALARDWLARSTTPEEKVRPNQCLGLILTDQGDFSGAQTAFADAVAGVPAGAADRAVPLMAMAGNAALANGDPVRALGWFDRALAVHDYGDAQAIGAIQIDRARALVGLGRPAEASVALAEARAQSPRDAGVFLLSATLARRGHDLAAAQSYIETAGALDPRDPAIGLEAGVIAQLAGRTDAARKSWSSVLTAAPASAEADQARGYLAQVGAGPSPSLDRPAPDPISAAGHH